MTDLPTLRYAVNLLPDESVVTMEGEYLGTWDTDETDALYQFTPDSESEPLFVDPYRQSLCNRIEQWNAESSQVYDHD